MNIYTFTGRLGQDAEVRFSQSGTAICNFNVAVDFGYNKTKGTNWIKCTMFGKKAEGDLPQYLKKGTLVAASGELKMNTWTKTNGEQVTTPEVTINTINLLSSNQQNTQNTQNTQSQQNRDDDMPF